MIDRMIWYNEIDTYTYGKSRVMLLLVLYNILILYTNT